MTARSSHQNGAHMYLQHSSTPQNAPAGPIISGEHRSIVNGPGPPRPMPLDPGMMRAQEGAFGRQERSEGLVKGRHAPFARPVKKDMLFLSFFLAQNLIVYGIFPKAPKPNMLLFGCVSSSTPQKTTELSTQACVLEVSVQENIEHEITTRFSISFTSVALLFL